MPIDWTTFGVDLHVELDATSGRRTGLERALRDAIRTGRLTTGTRLPSTRALAAELAVSRGTVTTAYDQLITEGYLSARHGSGTMVAGLIPAPAAGYATTSSPSPLAVPPFDLTPGRPDVTTFPATIWVRAVKRALAGAPASVFGYGDPRGLLELRIALAEYLGRARGVLAAPERIVIASGYVQALGLLTEVLGGERAAVIAMEDPGLSLHRDVVRRRGGKVVALPVDELGARTDLLSGLGDVRAAVLTPAHHFPMGVTLHPRRRHAAATWARATGRLVIEDDYDGEFRYDRQPVGALQGMAPGRVVYIGTAAKTLAPGLRLAWMVLPEQLVEPVVEAKRYADWQSDVIGQLALAEMITSHAYDRHIRSCRLRYRRRRDLLVSRLGALAPRGIAAGLHALIRLPLRESDVRASAAEQGLSLGYLSRHWHTLDDDHPQGIIAGYAAPSDSAFPAALDALVRVLAPWLGQRS